MSLDEAELSLKHMLKRCTTPGLMISIDETQATNRADLIAIATAVQHQIRERRNIAIVFAGLPQILSDLSDEEPALRHETIRPRLILRHTDAPYAPSV